MQISQEIGSLFFSDESTFQLYPRENRKNEIIWTNNLEEVPNQPWVIHCQKVTVWRAVGSKGKTKSYLFIGTCDSKIYQEALKISLISSVHKMFKNDPWVLIQDGAQPYTSKIRKDWMVDKGINYATLPPNSPDINIIEKVWAFMK